MEPVGQDEDLGDYVRDQLLSVGKTKKKSVTHIEAFFANQSDFHLLNAGPIISWSVDGSYKLFETQVNPRQVDLDRLTMMPELAVWIARTWGCPGDI